MPPVSNVNSQNSQLIGNRKLVMYWLARGISSVSYQMLSVAVGWQIYALTSSPFYLGMVGLVQFLPMVLLTLPVGHVADRYDRRHIVLACQITEGAGVLLLTAGSYRGVLSAEGILVVMGILGAARSFEMPAMHALLPNLVEAQLFSRAIAWNASSVQTSVIIGPALGGLLYTINPTIAYGSAGLLFFAATFFMALIGTVRTKEVGAPLGVHSLFAGLAFIRSSPPILGAISLDLFAVLLGGATALLPVYAREVLDVGPRGLGLLRCAPAAGALIMSIFLTRNPIRRRVGRTMFGAVIVFGAATMVFAVSRSFLLSLFVLAVLGASDIISVVIRQSLVQVRTPDELRGRVSAVNSMFIGTSNQLGEFESGVTAAWLGVVPAVFAGGAGTVAVAILWIFLFRSLARTDMVEN